MHLRTSKSGFVAMVLAIVAALAIAACGSSNNTTSSSTPASSGSGNSSASSGSSSSGSTPQISASAFTNDFSAMSQLAALAKAGHGSIAAILPDTTSSTRYVEFDQPDLKAAAAKVGVPITVQNAGGSDQQFVTDAQSDITNGATVLLIDPENSGTGVQVENLAKQKGVAVVDYDRLDTGGPNDPYVSFNNVRVGQLMGQGFETCAAAWHVKHPNVIVMRGDPTDNNASLFYQGYYNDVLAAKFKSGAYSLVANTAGTWTPSVAQTEFEQAYTAHPNANSALIPNDENGAPIITYLKAHGVKPMTFPTTGQDATLTGLQNILSGYQCGTVYKAVYKEAQAAVALALYLRAGKTAPASLLNGTTTDPTNHASRPSVLLTPVWVTTKNMNSTIIADKFVPKSQLCSGSYAADCKKYGIN
ncbi:MAG TPA: substrate-binding domain-containing protein [Solirubrobacteraceae bacterium]|nr:substrate-binding domain-containing protein [Solirubrobacteraceae bacterium]